MGCRLRQNDTNNSEILDILYIYRTSNIYIRHLGTFIQHPGTYIRHPGYPTSGYLYPASGHLYPKSGYLYPTSGLRLGQALGLGLELGLGQGYRRISLYTIGGILYMYTIYIMYTIYNGGILRMSTQHLLMSLLMN